jgi:vacuolar-type H+-ATPase subunit E/Vma4
MTWTYDVGNPNNSYGSDNGSVTIIGNGLLTKVQVRAALDSHRNSGKSVPLATINVAGNFNSVGFEAFLDVQITSILFATNSPVTTFGNGIFWYSGITTLRLPPNLTNIPNAMCEFCESLQSPLIIPQSVTSIGNTAFADCFLLESITIPSGVRTIGDESFYNCRKLNDLKFAPGSQLTTVGTRMLEDCPSLQSVEFPQSLTTIGIDALWDAVGIRMLRMNRVLWDSIRARLPENPSTSQRITFYGDPNVYLVMRSNSSGIVIDSAAQDAAEEKRLADLAAAQTLKDEADRTLRGSISIIMIDGFNRAQPFMNEAKLQSNFTALESAKNIMDDARTRAYEKQRQINSASTREEATAYIIGRIYTVQDITTARTMIQEAIDSAGNIQRSDGALLQEITSIMNTASDATYMEMGNATTQLDLALVTKGRTTMFTAKTTAFLLQQRIIDASTRTIAYTLIDTKPPSMYELNNVENGIRTINSQNLSAAYVASITKLLVDASPIALNQLSNARTQSSLILLQEAETTITNAKASASAIVGYMIDARSIETANNLMRDARPTQQEIDSARSTINAALTNATTLENDNGILDQIKSNLSVASGQAYTLLNSATTSFAVNSAQSTIETAKLMARANAYFILTQSVKAAAETSITYIGPTEQEIKTKRTTIDDANNDAKNIKDRDDGLLVDILRVLGNAKNIAGNQLNSAVSQLRLDLVSTAIKTISDAITAATATMQQISFSSPRRVEASAQIAGLTPSSQDIQNARDTINTAIGANDTVTRDDQFLRQITSDLGMARTAAYTQLDNAVSLSSFVFVTAAEKTISDAKTAANAKMQQISSPTKKTLASGQISGLTPSSQEIQTARERITTALNGNPIPSVSPDDRQLEEITLELRTASTIAYNQLDSAVSQLSLDLVNAAEKTISDAKTAANAKMQQISSPTKKAQASDQITVLTPTLQEIQTVVQTIKERTTTTNDNSLFETIQSTMDDATSTARTQLNNATTDADVDAAQTTMDSARTEAQGRQNLIVSLAIKTQAGDYINGALPSARDILSARSIVNTSDSTDRDNLLLLDVRQKIDTASSTAQDRLLKAQTVADVDSVQRNFGTAKADALENQRKILSASIRDVASNYIASAKPSAQDIEAVRTRFNKVATTWLEKNMTWVIVGSVLGVLVLLFTIYKFSRKRR